MAEHHPLDDVIADRFRSGASTAAIAAELGLRLAEVIGRVRAMDLKPPAPVSPEPDAEPVALPADVAAAPAETMPFTRPAKPQEYAEPLDHDADEGHGLVRRAGCPPGWLMSEAQVAQIFARSGGRFEDVVIRKPIHGADGRDRVTRSSARIPAATVERR